MKNRVKKLLKVAKFFKNSDILFGELDYVDFN